jgi:hypothetical protein
MKYHQSQKSYFFLRIDETSLVPGQADQEELVINDVQDNDILGPNEERTNSSKDQNLSK